MNIALCNRPETWPGGDMVQLRGYQKALQKLVYKADYLPYPIQSKSYDEAWIFHMNFWWALNHVKAAVRLGIPYRLFALYYPNLNGSISMDDMQHMLDNSKSIYCLSTSESKELIRDFPSLAKNKIRIIDNGVDRSLFYSSSTFRDGVISVGRFLPDKGHHFVIEACKSLDLPLTIVGFKSDANYENHCRELVKDYDMDVWCDLTQDQLALMYNQSKVVVCGSISERNNLAILEGAACGATPVDSIYNRSSEDHNFYKTDPSNPDDLATAIQWAWNFPTDYSSDILDWSDIVKDILDND